MKKIFEKSRARQVMHRRTDGGGNAHSPMRTQLAARFFLSPCVRKTNVRYQAKLLGVARSGRYSAASSVHIRAVDSRRD
jgi:hypothetical protein